MNNILRICTKLRKTIFSTKYLIIILVAITFSNSAMAQYTITDDDVVMEDGKITACFYSFDVKDIIIPEQLQGQTVTGIADAGVYWGGAFGYKNLTSLTFPKTIEYIGKYACRNNSFTEISFSGCSKLNYIGAESFCQSGIQSIDFTGCVSLERIEYWAFLGNSITQLDFSPCINLDFIGYRSFSGNSLSAVDITANTKLMTIAVNAFKENPGLTGFILPNVEKVGYFLNHWEASLSDTLWYMAAGDSATNFTALYKARLKLTEYTIIYNTAGGTHSNNTQYTMEESVVLTEAVKEGYTFLGWYDNAELSGVAVTEIKVGTIGNLEFWAAYEPVTYNITYNVTGGTHTNPTDYTIEITPFTLSAATKAGFTFIGWYNNAELTGNSITEIAEGTTGDLEFWANFNEGVTTYTITYNTDGGTHTNPSEYTAEITPFTLSPATKADHTFLGWFNNAELTGDIITQIGEGTFGDLEFWAKWELINGVSDNLLNRINIFPNPVNDNLIINLNQVDVENLSLFNISGKVIFSLSKPSLQQTVVNMENYKEGLYYLLISTSKGESFSKKIIKTN